MLSIMEQVHREMNEAFRRQASALTLVIDARTFKRTKCAAWIISSALGRLPTRDEFHAMYVGRDTAMLNGVHCHFNETPKPSRFKDEGIYRPTGACLPPLYTVNYATIDTMAGVVDIFPANTLDFLLLDERVGGEMNRLTGLMDRGAPTFTVILTRQEPWPNWAWHHLGTPVTLQDRRQASRLTN